MKKAYTMLVITLCCSLVQAAEKKKVAFSFDDIPRQAGKFFTPDERSIKLIAGLNRAGIAQAGFFINPDKLNSKDGKGGEDRIQAYVAAGHVIANHSNTHPWLSKTEVSEYLADIDAAEAWLEGRPGHRAWFRYPYLDEGRGDIAKRDAVREALAERGLRNAYVTIDNYDWHMDRLASNAKAGQQPMDMEELKNLYVETLLQAANFYDDIAVQVIGRSPAHVLLLHETDIAALFIEDLAMAFVADGWEIITIDEAYADPIAEIEPDTWFLGSGRVAALAHIQGWEPGDLVHIRTDEEVLNQLFIENVLAE